MARLDTVKLRNKKTGREIIVNAVDWGQERLRSIWKERGYEAVGDYHGDATREEESGSEASAEAKAKEGSTAQKPDTERFKKKKKKKTTKKVT